MPAPHGGPTHAFADVAALLDLDDAQFDTLKVLGRALHVNEADLGQTLEAILRSATSVISRSRLTGALMRRSSPLLSRKVMNSRMSLKPMRLPRIP